MNELLEALSSQGFSVPNLELNGKMLRFDRQGKKTGWFVGFENQTKKGDTYVIANFGDWKTGEKHEWRTERKYTKSEERDIARELRQSQDEFERERKKFQKIAKCDAQSRWDDGGTNINVPYLQRKSIPALFGCRSTLGNDGRVLLVPMRDCAGELWGLQTISTDGTKFFLTGQRIDGLFHVVGSDDRVTSDPLEKIEKILICEGFSTASSIHQATGLPVVCAFNAQNLPKVASELKEKYPTAAFVICGDEDQWTTDNEGKPCNQGRIKAERAAEACAGVSIFPNFSSLEALPTDFNDLHLMEGLGAVKDQILGAPEPEKQYVLCLGFSEDKYFYTSSQNKYIKGLTAANHTKLQLLNFLPLAYWESVYPGQNQDGVDWTLAADHLMEKCRKKGPFNLNNVRATGAWLGDKKELILNRGDMIILGGEKKGFHSLRSRYIYEPGDLILPEPGSNILSDSDCREFLETLCMLSWAHKDYYKFLAGWLMVAPICGALEWRPHLWLSGPSGSGKSTIMNEVVNRILRKIALFYTGQSTEAGIRQSLGKKALPVVFDEFETNDEKSGARIHQIIELIRQASYETDAFIVKGSADGTSINYLPRFCTLVSSVNVNLNFEADKNRFTVIELSRQEGDREASVQNFKDFQKRVDFISEEWVLGWYSRIFKLWPVFEHNRALLFDIISKRYNARFGQQYGTLLAGYSLCEQSTPICEEHAKWLVDTTDLELKSKESDDSDETECLNYLLRKKVYVNGSVNEDLSMFEVIQGARGEREIGAPGGTSTMEWQRILKRFGVVVKDDQILVANNHSEINSIFKGTKWSGIYDRSLKRIQGAGNNNNKPVWISGAVSKCTNIPIAAMFLGDGLDADA